MLPLEQAFDSLAAWCRARDYAGHDPFDALNSRLFQATPLARSRLARIAWTQALKRSPVNLRRLALVPAGKNSKGTALFALAWLARARTRNLSEDAREEARREAARLLDDLIDSRIETAHGAAWGYNFDWQSRAFFAPKGTPTVVPTAFAARALVEASREFGDEKYLRLARAACEFVLRDLNREESADEVCFSYSPLDRTRVFNAGLLASETLSAVGRLTGESGLCEWAARAARFVVRRQRADGAWPYGAQEFQSWVDNFHTAFVLLSLKRIADDCRAAATLSAEDAESFDLSLRRGYEFWRDRFFLADGFPKYYDNEPYPADVHSAAAAVVAFAELRGVDGDAPARAVKVARWSIDNLRDPRGFFYYQRRRFHTVRTPHMRWGQAWMLYALARLLEETDAEPGRAERDSD
jgi:hypothetical protein